MTTLQSQTNRRSDELLRILSPYDQIVIVMHDNPDPDAIATGWAVKALIETRLDLPVALVGGGGHAHRAGGKMSAVGESISDELEDELRRRWLAACGANAADGKPLISRAQVLG